MLAEVVLADPSGDRPSALPNVVNGVALGAAVLASWRRRRAPNVVGVAASMAVTM